MSTTDYFEWNESSVPDIDEYGLNIHPEGSSWVEQKLKPEDWCEAGICYFPALELIDYGQHYEWRVTAFKGKDMVDSSAFISFVCEDAPAPECHNTEVCEPLLGETAQNCPECSGGGSGEDKPIIPPLKAGSLWELVNNIINFFFIFGIVLAPLLIIYASIIMMTSAGDPDKLTKAKTIITWTVVALIIILLAKAIPAIVKGSLGG